MRKLTAIDYLEGSVREYPDKTAVICEDTSVTYRKFYTEIQKIGVSVRKLLNNRIQVPVLIFMEKGISCLEAMYGIAMSGNIYVPMDEKTPLERIRKIMDTSGTDLIIAGEKEEEKLRKSGFSGSIISFSSLVDRELNDADTDSLQKLKKQTVDTDLMYLLFTSGSTGDPKGVAVMHRSVVDYIEAFLDEVKLSSDDVAGNQTPFYADMSLKDLMVLYTGGTLVIIPQRFFMTPKKLLEYLDNNNVTTIMWVPTAYRLISQFDGLKRIKPSSLKRFVFSGESMPFPVFEYWLEHYPLSSSIYIQQYGPTEITGACTSHVITEEDVKKKILPIGRPFHNTGILLVDEKQHIVYDSRYDTDHTAGAEGEILVFGSCLAAGYYNNNSESRAAFIQNPNINTHSSIAYRTGDLGRTGENGELIFISRIDYQVKHGGKRIELGEIECAADQTEGLKACCCVHDDENDELILYFTGEVPEKAIKEKLMALIPKYMIPTKYVKLDELPMLPNGKLDRKSLKEYAKREV